MSTFNLMLPPQEEPKVLLALVVVAVSIVFVIATSIKPKKKVSHGA